MTFKSAFSRSLLTVLAVIFANRASARESASKLHIPWPLFESELKTTLENGAAPWRSTLPNTTMSVAGWNWNLSGLHVDAVVTTDSPVVNASQLFVRSPKLSLRLGIDRISIDQVIDRVVSGATFHIRLQASCGPIRLIQEQAQVEANLALDWTTGSPVARLANLGLAWSPGTWAVSEFACEGPQGFGDILKDEILKRTKEPTDIKPLLSDWLASQIQSRLQEALTKLKTPLSVTSGDAQLPLRMGTMSPVSTGLLLDMIFGEPTANPPVAPIPSADTLARLPKDEPTMLGTFDVLDHLVQNELQSHGETITVDLLTFNSFKSLLNSRFLQFFLWPDLFNYSKTSPFFLRLKTPQDLKLTSGRDGKLSTKLPIQAVVQSKRDNKWWDYVTASGKANADIDVKVSEGNLVIETSIADPQISIGFGKDYARTYGSTGWLPTSSIRDGLSGPQSALSGSHTLPDVDLGPAGQFRSSELSWADAKTFVISWKKTP